jgi:predicted 2-oxoglutarate/Fe(II)-dependent dioxygenase YbiX
MSHLPIWYLGQIPIEECDAVAQDLKTITPKDATMGADGEKKDTVNRNTTVRFASKEHLFGKKMFEYGMKANLECKWNFHLTDFEAIQFAEYGPNQHYNWHIDTFFLSGRGYDRKVTVVCLMNDPSEFEGGKLQMRFNQQEYDVPLVKGAIVAFPSFIEHQVTPVISGIRYTSTMWINGPEFA